MAMTKCKECGNEISTKADACPKCGAKQVRTFGCAKVVLVFLGLVVVLSIIGQWRRNSSTSVSSTNSNSTPVVTPPPAREPGTQWAYGQSDDPMAKGTRYGALVESTNTVDFGFPYSGPQHATLALRSHPRHGNEVILSIERGQFLCRSYEDCNVLVRFDDQKAQSYTAVGGADNSTETIFIRNYTRFVSSMIKAKQVRITTYIYQQGSPIFEFDVSGFNESKYKPK